MDNVDESFIVRLTDDNQARLMEAWNDYFDR